MDVTFKAGRGTTKFKVGSNAFVERIKKDLQETYSKTGDTYTYEQMVKTKGRVERAAKRELNKLIPFVTDSIIGRTQSNPSGVNIFPSFIAFDKNNDLYRRSTLPRGVTVNSTLSPAGGLKGGVLKWRALSPVTLKKKRQNKTSYFLHRGGLRRFLKSKAGQLIGRTGDIRIQIVLPKGANKKDQRVRYNGQLIVHLMPNTYARRLPGLASGVWSDSNPDMGFEQVLGIGGLNLAKLTGKAHFRNKAGEAFQHRPLLQPMFAYWYLHRIPQAMSAAIIKEF